MRFREIHSFFRILAMISWTIMQVITCIFTSKEIMNNLRCVKG